jgi:methyl-accepting chemotaxis protein
VDPDPLDRRAARGGRERGRGARGDLTHEISGNGKDEISRLLAALEKMQSGLRQLLGRVNSGVESLSSACTQIAAGNRDLSARTEQQASSLEETAASMEQMTSTVKQNADNAKQANQLAVTASDVASRGGAAVGRVVATMDEISAQSRKIAEIIGVIDGIAFQTNILALNAAVEAARAGEQGRGFAVVAGEVRNLAQRSAQAAREIKSLIGTSVEKVEAGGKQVAEAGATMSEIVSQVKRVTDLIGEITAATLEQSGGIGQVNQAVNHLDQMTQQNAALVEQSTAAAESLNDHVGGLAQAVAAFRVAQTDPHQRLARASAVRSPAAARPVPAARPGAAAAKAQRAPSRAPAAIRPPARIPEKPATPAAAPASTKTDAKPAKDEWEEF